MTGLTGYDRRTLAKARQVAEAQDLEALREVVEADDGRPDTLVYAKAFGLAQYLLRELAGMVERLAGAAPDDGSGEGERDGG